MGDGRRRRRYGVREEAEGWSSGRGSDAASLFDSASRCALAAVSCALRWPAAKRHLVAIRSERRGLNGGRCGRPPDLAHGVVPYGPLDKVGARHLSRQARCGQPPARAATRMEGFSRLRT